MIERFIHPELRAHASALLELIESCAEEAPGPDELAASIEANEDLMAAYNWAMTTLSQNHIVCCGGTVYMVPLLDPGFCAGLVEQAESLAANGGWRRNDCELAPYQIPEIVVKDRDQAMHDMLAALIKYMNIWHALICQAAPRVVGSIQFTKYTSGDCPAGSWHHDIDSDFTATVSLAPHLFDGGGTDLRISPTRSIHVPPLPAGYALLFNGQKVHHRGAQVTTGSRYLLTYWLSSK